MYLQSLFISFNKFTLLWIALQQW